MANDPALIDHTLLAPNATAEQIAQLCSEAREHGFATVCVSPTWVEEAAAHLAGSSVGVCTVIGFPSGATTTESKAFETTDAIAKGATEIDMVLNIGRLVGGDLRFVTDDIRAVKDAGGRVPLKVILETCLLTDEQIVSACEAAENAGADFVKTSTGFSTGGATTHHVELMRRIVGDRLGVKASGGIRTAEDMAAMVDAGASRIGTSRGPALIAGA